MKYKFPDDFVNKVIQDDCLIAMRNLPDKSVDMICCDPPLRAK